MVNLDYLRRIYSSIEESLCKEHVDGRDVSCETRIRISERTRHIRLAWLLVGILSAALLFGGYLECIFTVGASATFCQNNPTSLQLIEAVVLVINLLAVYVLVQLGEKQLKVEAKDRVVTVLEELHFCLRENPHHGNSNSTSTGNSIFNSVKLSSWHRLRVTDAQIPSVTYCYCSSDNFSGKYHWNLRPDCFLCAGDIIALQPGSVAPATIQLLPRKKNANTDAHAQGEAVTFERGEKIQVAEEAAQVGQLCLFKVLRPPLVDLLREYLAVHASREERADTMIPELWENVNSFTMIIVCGLVIVSVIANAIRLSIRPDMLSAFHLLFFRSLTVVVCLLPNLALPVLEQALELYATAELLAYYYHDENGKADLSFSEVYKYVRKLMWAWRPRKTTAISSSAFEAFSRDTTQPGTTLFRDHSDPVDLAEIVGIPLKRSRLLLRLGSITMLSCLDEGAVLSPLPRAEEVFLPKGDQAGVMLKLPSAKNANAPWFHGSSWKEQLPALKAVALSCMIGTSLHLNPRRAQQSEAPSFNLKQCLATLPAACSHIAVPDHLRVLPQWVGVGARNMKVLAPCLLVAVSDRSVPNRCHPVLTWSYHRNTARMYCLVVEDFARNMRKKRRVVEGSDVNKRELRRKLHILSWGHPKALLRCCAEYWDGESIWPLLPNDQSHIFAAENNWDKEDSDVIAFAYTPIPSSAAHLFPEAAINEPLSPPVSVFVKHVESASTESVQKSSKKPPTAAEPDQEQDQERMRNQVLRHLILNAQIFTGMVRSQEQPRHTLTRLIGKLDGAGIRFVHFSPRAPKRARSIAEKLGLETDWNTAISLLPLKKSPSEALEERSEWDVKAKLPHGVAEIRQHLIDVDDVPLRVPMFTDCDPASSLEMLSILQENGEIVGALGSAYSSHNFSMLLRAQASIAVQNPLLPPCCTRPNQTGFCTKTFNAGAHAQSFGPGVNSRSAASQLLELAGSINSLGSSLVLRRGALEYPVVYSSLRQARSLLLNYKQSLLFALSMHLLLALFTTFSYCTTLPDIMLPIHVIWISWVPGPLLTLPLIRTPAQHNIMKLMPSKDDKDKDAQKKKIARESSMRLLMHHLFRCAVSAVLLVVLSVYSAALFSKTSAHAFLWDNQGVTLSPEATAATQALTLFFIIWLSVWDGITYMYRNLSLVKEFPRNTAFPVCAIVAILLQIAYGELLCQSTRSFNQFRWLSEADAVVWICGFLIFPFISVCISEITKRNERKWYYKNMQRLRLLFETRLGMYSPR